jgi:hypothetical protein
MPGLPATTIQTGVCLAVPDVCLTPAPPGPPVPIPYPNTGMCKMALQFATKVMVMNMSAVNLGSQIPMSTGDEAGTGGGVTSGTIKGQVKWTKGSSKVKYQGKPAVIVTATTTQNKMNAVGVQDAPSQAKVLVAP